MRKYKWGDEEIKYVVENYPIHDRYTISNKLRVPVEQITYLVRKLGVKKNKSINYEEFKDIKTSYITYILGFMWADGHLTKDGRHFNVGGVEEDINEIEYLFDRVGNWCKSIHKMEKYGWRNTKYIVGSNKDIYNFLVENDYKNKSYVSADKILSKIPNNLKHYFFRGLIDGDGNFYYNKINYLRQFTLASTYEQDWSYFEELCGKLKIKYKITRTKKINKKTKKINKNSVLRILGKEVIKLGDYIYKGENFGLSRKEKKYEQIKNSYVSNKSDK